MTRPLLAGPAVVGLVTAFLLAGGTASPARGQVFSIELFPQFAVNVVGTEHTVTASVSQDGTPAGGNYTFEVIDGPNAGKTGQGPSFTYVGDGGPGTDTIMGCFVSEFCGTATKTWVEPSPTATPTPTPSPAVTPASAVPDTLPASGGPPPNGSSFPWGFMAALALAGLTLLAAGALAKPAGKGRG